MEEIKLRRRIQQAKRRISRGVFIREEKGGKVDEREILGRLEKRLSQITQE